MSDMQPTEADREEARKIFDDTCTCDVCNHKVERIAYAIARIHADAVKASVTQIIEELRCCVPGTGFYVSDASSLLHAKRAYKMAMSLLTAEPHSKSEFRRIEAQRAAEPEPCEDAREVACSIDEVWKVLGDDTGETARICLDNAAQRIESYASRLAHEARADERRRAEGRFRAELGKCVEIMPSKVEAIITGSDIERISSTILQGTEPTKPQATDELLWQEIYSLREKLKIAVAAVKSINPDFDDHEFIHRLNSVDYDQLIEELSGTEPAKVSEDVERYAEYLRRFIQDHAFPASVAYDLNAALDRLVARLKEENRG